MAVTYMIIYNVMATNHNVATTKQRSLLLLLKRRGVIVIIYHYYNLRPEHQY